MLEMGIIVALGLIFTFFKMSWKSRLTMLSKPLAMDLFVFVALNVLHWGTFSGIMVAATGALFCSVSISLGRRLFGFIEQGRYVRGFFDISAKI